MQRLCLLVFLKVYHPVLIAVGLNGINAMRDAVMRITIVISLKEHTGVNTGDTILQQRQVGHIKRYESG